MLIFSISFPDLIKISLLYPWKKGLGRKEAQRQGDFTNNFSIYTYTCTQQNIYTGHVTVFDKYLNWARVSVKIYIYIYTATG
jgi:hypothetical protein